MRVCDGEEATPCTHPARVATYFEPVVRMAGKDGDGKTCRGVGERLSATFRGRPLSGVSIKVMSDGRVIDRIQEKDNG